MSDTYEGMSDRELDALVAERVMGWKQCRLSPGVWWLCHPDVIEGLPKSIWYTQFERDGELDIDAIRLPGRWFLQVPRYTTNPADRDAVVEKMMRKHKSRVTIYSDFGDHESHTQMWIVKLVTGPGLNIGSHSMGAAPTLGRAVVIASLRVMDALRALDQKEEHGKA